MFDVSWNFIIDCQWFSDRLYPVDKTRIDEAAVVMGEVETEVDEKKSQ
jgi:hypothetical protein